MDYSSNNRRGNKRHWNNNNRRNENNRRNNEQKESFRRDVHKGGFRNSVQLPQQVQDEMIKDQQSIRELKQRHPNCAHCGKPIAELSTALADRSSGEPVHFDCVLNILNQSEKLQDGEKITYIGQGRFAIVKFPVPHDFRNFNIVRVIEWEPKDKKYSWREDIAGAFSQVH